MGGVRGFVRRHRLWAAFLAAFLPWADAPDAYPYPDYLRSVVDPRTGDVDTVALNKALDTLRPHANV